MIFSSAALNAFCEKFALKHCTMYCRYIGNLHEVFHTRFCYTIILLVSCLYILSHALEWLNKFGCYKWFQGIIKTFENKIKFLSAEAMISEVYYVT